MKLQTKVDIEAPGFGIDYGTRMMMLGSCFAENIGSRLRSYKFNVDVNPCGVIYNPLSVANTLRLLLSGRDVTADKLLFNNGKWVSLQHHGSFSSPGREECLENINAALKTSSDFLTRCDVLFVTFGTSWVYRFKATGEVVSNCHKLDAKAFERHRLTVDEIVRVYDDLIHLLRQRQPLLKIVFTVSPIRHWKDGANGNQLSKAVLLLAIDELVHRHQEIVYFPAYEIVMDELRDYRFYADDMLHVSAVAVDYIWERFRDRYVAAPESLMSQIYKVTTVLAHRPSEPADEAYQSLLARTLHTIEDISTQCGEVDFSEEKKFIADMKR